MATFEEKRKNVVENLNENERLLNKYKTAASERADKIKDERADNLRNAVYDSSVREYQKQKNLNPPGTIDGSLDKGLDTIGDTVRSIGKAFGYNKMTSMDDEAQMAARKDVKGYKKGGRVKKMADGGELPDTGAGAGRGKQGGPTAAEMNKRNSDSYMSPSDQRAIKEDEDFKKMSAKNPDQAYKKGGMASASKRADGIARRGHTRCACGGGKM